MWGLGRRLRKSAVVALSFAGEDREYVDAVAKALKSKGIKVFYDRFDETDLWGKDLYAYLSDLYRNRARFTVMFISAAYGKKRWPNHERQGAQARAFSQAEEYILPARFDDTEVPGMLPTVGYVSLTGLKPEDFAVRIIDKLVSSGGAVPSDLVRRDFSTAQRAPRVEPTKLEVYVRDDEGAPIAGATVVAVADNSTTVNGITGPDGLATLIVQVRRVYTLLTAHPNYPASMIERIDPTEVVEVMLPRTNDVGSLIIHGTGYIPGIEGRLNPILDTSNRTYLYAANIAINGGTKQQPEVFVVGESFELEDRNGTITLVVVKLIRGQTALLQYLRPQT